MDMHINDRHVVSLSGFAWLFWLSWGLWMWHAKRFLLRFKIPAESQFLCKKMTLTLTDDKQCLQGSKYVYDNNVNMLYSCSSDTNPAVFFFVALLLALSKLTKKWHCFSCTIVVIVQKSAMLCMHILFKQTGKHARGMSIFNFNQATHERKMADKT